MIIAPVLFGNSALLMSSNYHKKFSAENTRMNPNNNSYEDSFNSKYKTYKVSVPLISNTGKRITGTAFVKAGKEDIIVKIADNNGKELGEATGDFKKSEVWVAAHNYHQKNISNVKKTAYDVLLRYVKKHHPDINTAKVNITNDSSYRFHIAYGFTDNDKNDPNGYNSYFQTNILEYPLR